MLEVATPHGPARAHLHPASAARGALVLGHGAGGGVSAPDLLLAAEVAGGLDLSVALVEQPYRVAGRRSTPAAHILDVAWIAVIEQLRAGALAGLPVVTGGRSAGARVACRTAAVVGAAGVLCLAFPLVAPSGKSRQDELDGVAVPVLVVQGTATGSGCLSRRAFGRSRSSAATTGSSGPRRTAQRRRRLARGAADPPPAWRGPCCRGNGRSWTEAPDAADRTGYG